MTDAFRFFFCIYELFMNEIHIIPDMSTPLDRLRSFALATLDFTLGTLWRVRERTSG